MIAKLRRPVARLASHRAGIAHVDPRLMVPGRSPERALEGGDARTTAARAVAPARPGFERPIACVLIEYDHGTQSDPRSVLGVHRQVRWTQLREPRRCGDALEGDGRPSVSPEDRVPHRDRLERLTQGLFHVIVQRVGEGAALRACAHRGDKGRPQRAGVAHYQSQRIGAIEAGQVMFSGDLPVKGGQPEGTRQIETALGAAFDEPCQPGCRVHTKDVAAGAARDNGNRRGCSPSLGMPLVQRFSGGPRLA